MDSKGQTIILENVAESGSDNAPADMSDLTDIEIANLKQLRRVKTNDLQLRLDKHGLPLVPQPSTYKDDPLVSTYNNNVSSWPPADTFTELVTFLETIHRTAD